MKKLVKRYVQWMVQNEVIKEENQNLCEYGLVQGIVMIVNIMIALLTGTIFGCIPGMLSFLLCYVPLRSFVGGFHFEKPLVCFVFSVAMDVLVAALLHFGVWNTVICLGTMILIGGFLFFCSPCESPNKKLTQTEKKRYRILIKMMLAIEVLAGGILFSFVSPQVWQGIFWAWIAAGIMLLTGKTSKNKIKS